MGGLGATWHRTVGQKREITLVAMGAKRARRRREKILVPLAQLGPLTKVFATALPKTR